MVNFTTATDQNPVANFRGYIGSATGLGVNLNIARPAVSFGTAPRRLVRFLGNIYADNSINLNGNILNLGNDRDAGRTITIFRDATPGNYIVSTTINNTGGAGELRVRDYNYTFQGDIGGSTTALTSVSVNNAKASFGGNVYAGAVSFDSSSELALTNNVAISGTLNVNRGAALSLDDNTLTVTRMATFRGTTGTAPKLSLKLDGNGTKGRLKTDGGVTFINATAGLSIDVTIENADSIANTGPEEFIIIESNAALPAALANIMPTFTGLPVGATGVLTRGGTNNSQLILTVTRPRQIITTTASGQSLTVNGRASGIEFRADGSVNIPDGVPTIGDRDGVSIVLNPGTGAPSVLGGLTFNRTTSVTGRVGDKLSNTANTAFNTTLPSERLGLIRLTDGAFTRFADVTFNRGVDVNQLQFIDSNSAPRPVVRLNGSGANGFHRITNVTTNRGGGRGTLIFGNNAGAANAANLLAGTIGTPSNRLGGLTIAARAASGSEGSAAAREVRFLGNIYADGIAINDNTLVLGGDVFGAPPADHPDYVIDAPITGTSAARLDIRDFNTELKGEIGTTASALNRVSIANARATFGANIHAATTDVSNGTLKAGADLSVSGALRVLGVTSGAATLPSTLALGTHKLSVSGVARFAGATSANPHTLSVTVGKNAAAESVSGELNAAATGASVTLDASVHLRIDVQVDPETGGFIETGDTFTIARSNVAFAALPAGVTVRSSTTAITFGVTRGADNKTLVLTATVARSPQRITDTTPEPITLNANGTNSGVVFAASDEKTLSIVDDRPSIGALQGVSVITNGGAIARGSIDFDATSAMTVSGRIGGRLDQASGANRVFKANPTNRLNRLNLNTANTVTFNGGVGASQLVFAAGATASLNGSGAVFHQMDVTHAETATVPATGLGTLRFNHRATQVGDAANFRGDIGTPSKKLASLTIAGKSGLPARTVRILGNIYAGGIELNGEGLSLGNGAFFGTDLSTVRTVDAPITTSMQFKRRPVYSGFQCSPEGADRRADGDGLTTVYLHHYQRDRKTRWECLCPLHRHSGARR